MVIINFHIHKTNVSIKLKRIKKRNRKGRTSEREVRGEALEHIQIIKPYFKEMLNSCISNEV